MIKPSSADKRRRHTTRDLRSSSAERAPLPCKGNQRNKMPTAAIKSLLFYNDFFRHFDVVEGTRNRSREMAFSSVLFRESKCELTVLTSSRGSLHGWIKDSWLPLLRREMIKTLIASWRDGGNWLHRQFLITPVTLLAALAHHFLWQGWAVLLFTWEQHRVSPCSRGWSSLRQPGWS